MMQVIKNKIKSCIYFDFKADYFIIMASKFLHATDTELLIKKAKGFGSFIFHNLVITRMTK